VFECDLEFVVPVLGCVMASGEIVTDFLKDPRATIDTVTDADAIGASLVEDLFGDFWFVDTAVSEHYTREEIFDFADIVIVNSFRPGCFKVATMDHDSGDW